MSSYKDLLSLICPQGPETYFKWWWVVWVVSFVVSMAIMLQVTDGVTMLLGGNAESCWGTCSVMALHLGGVIGITTWGEAIVRKRCGFLSRRAIAQKLFIALKSFKERSDVVVGVDINPTALIEGVDNKWVKSRLMGWVIDALSDNRINCESSRGELANAIKRRDWLNVRKIISTIHSAGNTHCLRVYIVSFEEGKDLPDESTHIINAEVSLVDIESGGLLIETKWVILWGPQERLRLPAGGSPGEKVLKVICTAIGDPKEVGQLCEG